MNICVLFRSCGERTADASLESIRRSLPNIACAHLYGDTPHAATLQTVNFMQSFSEDYDAFLILDSDTILYDGQPVLDNLDIPLGRFILVDRFVKDHHYFGPWLIGKVLVESLCQARDSLDQKNRDWFCDPLRTLVRMAIEGSDIEEDQVCRTIGVHDYMQNHRDIFRKFIYRGWKLEDEELFERLLTMLKQRNTPECKAAVAGLRHSRIADPISELGIKDAEAAFLRSGIKEKPPMIDQDELEEAYNEFTQFQNITIRNRDPKTIVKKPTK